MRRTRGKRWALLLCPSKCGISDWSLSNRNQDWHIYSDTAIELSAFLVYAASDADSILDIRAGYCQTIAVVIRHICKDRRAICSGWFREAPPVRTHLFVMIADRTPGRGDINIIVYPWECTRKRRAADCTGRVYSYICYPVFILIQLIWGFKILILNQRVFGILRYIVHAIKWLSLDK